MKRVLLSAAAVLLGITVACGPGEETSFHVAPDGNDASAGTLEKPFATLKRARDAVREAKKAKTAPIKVLLRGGSYRLSETLVLTLDDSGTERAPVVYQAHENELPVISGGANASLHRFAGWAIRWNSRH